MKRALVIVALIALMVSLMEGCGGSAKTEQGDAATTEKADNQTEDVEGRAITLEELAGFDGKEGRPAYVAVDGIVYDLSGSATWPEGKHTPCNLQAMAGRDLSEEIEQAPPRMRDYLRRFPVVGTLRR